MTISHHLHPTAPAAPAMLKSTKIAVFYILFAIIATAANIGAQDIFTRIYIGPLSILLSIAAGTAAGLVVKYTLDKRYIFQFKARDTLHDSQVFLLYSFMGLATTAIFWGFEFTFEYLFESKEMRYLGGIIGLAIGYIAKYHLDKRFVFRTDA
ncbi:GtrA family protein [Pseudomonas nitroreducens]|uniref:GtrA family protein n=1 Tax=Pseudomonas nitroreducens TaxID=46680 RepID=UPI0020A0C989|nr:GtrA family protein [Pseudomonas nitroreducens]MCP1624154.1 putative flippase GtrA [Pseudomonas nitroreducens]